MVASEIVIQRDNEQLALPCQLPLLPLRDVVVFPYMVTPLLVGRTHSINAVEAASEHGSYICVLAQQESEVVERSPVVRFVHPHAVREETDHERDNADQTMPQPVPEICGRGLKPRRARRAARAHKKQQHCRKCQNPQTFDVHPILLSPIEDLGV